MGRERRAGDYDPSPGFHEEKQSVKDGDRMDVDQETRSKLREEQVLCRGDNDMSELTATWATSPEGMDGKDSEPEIKGQQIEELPEMNENVAKDTSDATNGDSLYPGSYLQMTDNKFRASGEADDVDRRNGEEITGEIIDPGKDETVKEIIVSGVPKCGNFAMHASISDSSGTDLKALCKLANVVEEEKGSHLEDSMEPARELESGNSLGDVMPGSASLLDQASGAGPESPKVGMLKNDPSFDGRLHGSGSEDGIAKIDEKQQHGGIDMDGQHARREDCPYYQSRKEEQFFPSLFKICDLNLMESSDGHENQVRDAIFTRQDLKCHRKEAESARRRQQAQVKGENLAIRCYPLMMKTLLHSQILTRKRPSSRLLLLQGMKAIFGAPVAAAAAVLPASDPHPHPPPHNNNSNIFSIRRC
ncbi:hypothetical protein MLD38_000868 [Melastoma candidum]|uniref:Uncharacterized protein n=1 Tax=Melastoma candidum TaxID=119954 RepID=A0ACB9SFD9_9MYRT|nr:hypothetical protein MLD38_000868 [Melastoma candidum]